MPASIVENLFSLKRVFNGLCTVPHFSWELLYSWTIHIWGWAPEKHKRVFCFLISKVFREYSPFSTLLAGVEVVTMSWANLQRFDGTDFLQGLLPHNFIVHHIVETHCTQRTEQVIIYARRCI